MTTFEDLNLHKNIKKALITQGYTEPTPIQQQAIPPLLEGRDLLGIAQTGTGKTAAFALPCLDYLIEEPLPRQPNAPRILVLAPTRELAIQIGESFENYSANMDCVTQVIYGGVKAGQQIRALNKGCHVLVATPGRLLDLMNQKAVHLNELDILVLDEADQMLDLGFIHDLKKIMSKVPDERQTLLFSATMPKLIADMAGAYLHDPVRVSVAPESTTAERVTQGVLHVSGNDKLTVLEKALKDPTIERALVFARTKHGSDAMARKLMAKGIQVAAIHGNKSQNQRLRALDAFKTGETKVLIATDIAARGIDIKGISHVFNYDLPNVPEQYVHRIGRTARAGEDGYALSLVAGDEVYYLREIEKVTAMEIPLAAPPAGCEGLILPEPDRSKRVPKPKGPARSGRSGGGQSRGGPSRGVQSRGGQGGSGRGNNRPNAKKGGSGGRPPQKHGKRPQRAS